MERSVGYSSVASLSTHQVVQNLEPLPCYNREKHGILTEPCDERSYQAAICRYGRQCTEPATGWISLFVRNDMVLNTFPFGPLLRSNTWWAHGYAVGGFGRWISLSARNDMKGNTGLKNSCRVSFGNKIDKGVSCHLQAQLRKLRERLIASHLTNSWS